MRLWLDDVRMSPWGYDLWAKTYDECVRLLEEHSVGHVSLDHDLGTEHTPSQQTPASQETRSRRKQGTTFFSTWRRTISG